MSNLGPTIRDCRCEAASLSTESLRTEIEVHLEVLDEMIDAFYGIDPVDGDPSELWDVSWGVVLEALTVSLFVRELTTRPVRPFAWVRLSRN